MGLDAQERIMAAEIIVRALIYHAAKKGYDYPLIKWAMEQHCSGSTISLSTLLAPDPKVLILDEDFKYWIPNLNLQEGVDL